MNPPVPIICETTSLFSLRGLLRPNQLVCHRHRNWFIGRSKPENARAFMEYGFRVFRVFNKRVAWSAPA